MKTHYKGMLLLLFAVLSLGLLAPQPAGAEIAATPLPLGEFSQGWVYSVNNSGQISGGLFVVSDDDYDHACLWDFGTSAPTLLDRAAGELDGFVHTYGEYINSSGQVAGTAWEADWNNSRGFFWTDAEGMVDIGVPVTGDYTYVYFYVLGLNDSGQVLAYVDGSVDSTSFIWSDGATTELTYTDEYSTTYDIDITVGGINNSGQVAGRVPMGAGNCPAVLWEDGTATILTPSGLYAGETHINNNGQVAGSSSGDGQNPWIYDFGTGDGLRFIDVTGQYPDMASGMIYVTDLNDAGQVLIFQNYPVIRAMVWEDDGLGGDQFTEIPLTTVVGPESYNPSVNNLNEQGQATVYVAEPGANRYFVWDPAWPEAMAELTCLTGTTRISLSEMNDAGLVAGNCYPPDYSIYLPCTWQADADAVNYPPDLNVTAAPASGFAGTEITFTAKATDPDVGDTLAFSLDSDAPTGAAINAVTGYFSWTPAAAGLYTFTVRVADSQNFYDTEKVTIDVARPSALPLTVQSVDRRGKFVVVSVLIENPTAADVTDVSVTAATLGGANTASRLPLGIKKIRPGTGKTCRLKFVGDVVPPGEASFSVDGTCSLGGFFITETVTVP